MRRRTFVGCLLTVTALGCTDPDPFQVVPEDWSFPEDTTKHAVTLYCESSTVAVGETFDVKGIIYNVPDVFGAAIQVEYDTTRVEVTNVLAGPYLGPSDSGLSLARDEREQQRVSFAATLRQAATGSAAGSASGVLLKLKCRARARGEARFRIDRGTLQLLSASGAPVDRFGSLHKEDLRVSVE